MNNLRRILSEAITILETNNIENPQIDAWLLCEHVFGVTKAEYYTNPNKTVSIEKRNEYIELVKKRSTHIPLQHVIGTQEFMGYSFRVNEHVLIPRPETELLVEKAIKLIQLQNKTKVLDMCTGSGCIIISILKNTNLTKAVGVDISPEALDMSKQNAKDNQCENIDFLQSNLFEKVSGYFDVIISNPPYIPTKDVEELQDEVRLHDPKLALDGKEDGLFFYREITKNAKQYLTHDGYLLFEIGYNQAEDVRKIMSTEGFDSIEVSQDYGGFDRIVIGKLGGINHV